MECRQDQARLPFSKMNDVRELVQMFFQVFSSLSPNYAAFGPRLWFVQQLRRQQDNSQFLHWELEESSRSKRGPSPQIFIAEDE